MFGLRNYPSDGNDSDGGAGRLSTTTAALRGAVNTSFGVRADVINISQGLSNDINTKFGNNRAASLYTDLDSAVGFVVNTGRGGLGTTIVKSAGNARGGDSMSMPTAWRTTRVR